MLIFLVLIDTPKLNITLEKQWHNLTVEYNEIPTDQIINEPYDEDKGPKMYVTNIIRRYSGYSKKDEIQKYVEENYIGDDITCFISGK